MFFLKFLTDQLDPNDEVTRSFVELVLPELMVQYAITPAKGGDHTRDVEFSEEQKRKFAEKDDQSMVSHLLNGIFPTMRLLNLLEAEQVGRYPFSQIERRVYLCGYLMHDIDKILRQHGIATQDRTAIDEAKAIIATQLRLCNVVAFFPEYELYLEDITYLAVNTQRVWGTHLHTYLWRLHLPERRIFVLRDLCTFSDHIAYLVSSPSAILSDEQTQTLRTLLAVLSDDTLVFSYHQLREVRGLLTSVVNTGLVQLFTEERKGIWPYLFFSDGVVYIKRASLALAITTAQMVEKVQQQLRELCGPRIKSFAPGFKFDNKGIPKPPQYYYDFLTLEEYTELLVRFTIERTATDITAKPFAKIQEMQANRELAAEIPTDFVPDVRIGMLARFFSVIFVTLLDMLDAKRDAALRERVSQAVIKHLGMEAYWLQAQAIPNKGGVEYRWFWLGACYLRDHPGIDRYDGVGNLSEVFHSTMQLVLSLAGDALRQAMPQHYLNHLTAYLSSVVELPTDVRANEPLPNFQAEMERYTGAKTKGRQLLCTLCNSAYPTEEQSDNAVLFQPWVYKNKLSLYAGKNAGGICTLCALELMLRQILQKGQLRLTGSKFEALKTKYLAIYPNFFFTAETGAMVQGMLDQLQDINFFTVRRQLNGDDMTVQQVMALEAFAAPVEQAQTLQTTSFHDDDSEDDEDTDEGVEEDGNTAQRHDRSYIKFQPSAYPGLLLFGMRAGRETDDTSTWAMPAFLALALPLITSVKVVVSEMSLPLFSSGHDFRETVIFDAPHPYLNRLLKKSRLRVDELLRALCVLTAIYEVNLDTYANKGNPEWKHLSGISRDLDTDPFYLFSYLRKQQRENALPTYKVDHYLHIYEAILEEDMSKIQQCVDLYTQFYRGGYESHSILKPVDIVARAIINSPLNIEEDDLLWQIQGELQSWLDRVRSHQAAGWAVFHGKEISTQEEPAVRAFVTYFHKHIFLDYCYGERGTLRSRLNRFKDGCEAYYVHQRNAQRIQEQQEAVAVAQ